MAAISASMVKELRDRTGLGMLECKTALREAEGDIELAIENLRKSSGMKAAKKAGRVAADGAIVTKVAADGSYGIVLEVNSETDFVARDEGFKAFAELVVNKAFETKETDIAALMAGELEAAREALVQKIGENISVRRAAILEAPAGGLIGEYVHGGRIGVLSALVGGNADVAKDVAMHVAAANPRVARPEEMPEEELQKEKEIIMAQPDMEGKPQEIKEKMAVGRVKKFLAENSLVEQAFIKDPSVTVGAFAKANGGEVQSFIRIEVGEGIEVVKEDFAEEVRKQAGL
ncbi:translation elongation factor Ts (EF-Ts) [Oceanospirillum multiglobuliferum]|uniref:Elongation factor Ts n=1 Tax=Oceanospirillum multiglobuliferum TaxID=64969 RepID=A0A1T4RTI9_9GAMM|nr:translation elongation factor Ts [Oceanospirillum multiglobuliferum]OPX54646.1 translation elongation factor Ts [Oceanospirillum multiglobuliferum]SKA19273.1 translation elongation factor Ts (EF-Ts) [Oceanospirillum multiglobuliferum]